MLRRVVAFFTVSTVLASVLVATPGTAGAGAETIALHIRQWQVDYSTGSIAFDVALTGEHLNEWEEICSIRCRWSVKAVDRSGDFEVERGTVLFGKSGRSGRATIDERVQGTNSSFRQVTHLVATVTGRSQVVLEQEVSPPYPAGHFDLVLNTWDPHPTLAGFGGFDLDVRGKGMWTSSSPCEGWCQLTVRPVDRSTGVELERPSILSQRWDHGTWEFDRKTASTGMVVGEATHVVATLVGANGITWTREVEVGTGELANGLEVGTVAAALTGANLLSVCTYVIQAQPTRGGSSTSLGAFGEACVAAASGGPTALARLAVSYGPEVTAIVVVAAGWAGGVLDDDFPSLPAPLPSQPWTAPAEVLVDFIVERLLRTDDGVSKSPSDSEAAVATCVDQVASASVPGALPGEWISSLTSEQQVRLADGDHLCEVLPIFFPGTQGPAATATAHIRDAISSTPIWTMLSYKPGRERAAQFVAAGVPAPPEFIGGIRAWYRVDPRGLCPNPYPTGQELPADPECDEYPFFTTSQSGPSQVSSYGTDASLRLMERAENQAGSQEYGEFLRECLGVNNRQTDLSADSRAFLVVPQPEVPLGGSPLGYLCELD